MIFNVIGTFIQILFFMIGSMMFFMYPIILIDYNNDDNTKEFTISYTIIMAFCLTIFLYLYLKVYNYKL